MTASENSFLGFAPQTERGVIVEDDEAFTYILFSEGSMEVNNIVVPLDQEIGGGALVRDAMKPGVVALGEFQFIPRGDALGWILLGLFGASSMDDSADPLFEHTFYTPEDDQFEAPYFTVRMIKGGMWQEIFYDCRFVALDLAWKPGDYIRGTLGIMGVPSEINTDAYTDPAPDGGAPFIAPVSLISVEPADGFAHLSGSLSIRTSVPLDEQWVLGRTTPHDFDINSRMVVITSTVKVKTEEAQVLFAYDGSYETGSPEWTPIVYKEATGTPVTLSTSGANPVSLEVDRLLVMHASDMAWQITPISMQAGRPVIASITGTCLAGDYGAGTDYPVSVILENAHDTAYEVPTT